MPEGHAIHRIATSHTKLLAGTPIRVTSPQGRFAEGAALVDGASLERIEAYGKHLFYWWDNDLIGHVHLGLYGRFHIDAQPTPNTRMRLETPSVTIDLAGPTDCSIGDETSRAAILARLGPDPLRRDGRVAPVIERVSASRQPIGALLLDQRVVAGAGNIFRAEALFLAGIDPRRTGRDCSVEDVQRIWDELTTMMRRGVRDGRIVTIDKRLVPDKPGRGETTYVYHRDRCIRCGTPIAEATIGARDCYWCPTCQPS